MIRVLIDSSADEPTWSPDSPLSLAVVAIYTGFPRLLSWYTRVAHSAAGRRPTTFSRTSSGTSVKQKTPLSGALDDRGAEIRTRDL